MRILVAEDSPCNRLLVGAHLKGGPHTPLFVENGELAVNEYSKDAFDLILMDIQMPVMDGLEAARSIRTIEKERGLPAIPIVALSATTRAEDVQLSLDSGCNALISKPISKQRLLEAIERHGTR